MPNEQPIELMSLAEVQAALRQADDRGTLAEAVAQPNEVSNRLTTGGAN